MQIPAPSSDMPLARRVPEIRRDRSLRSSNRRSRDRRNHSAPESKPNPASQKSTTLLWKWSFSYQKVSFAHFRGFVDWSVHVSKSSHPRIDRTLSVRRIAMSCFRPDESPKFGIVLRSSNRRSWDRRNHVVAESKPNPASPHLCFENEAFFLAFLIKMFFLAHFRGFVAFVVLWFGLSKFQNLTVHASIVSTKKKTKNCPCTCPLNILKLLKLYRSYVVSTNNCPWTCPLQLLKLEKILAFPASQNPRPQLYFENVSFL